ncbi:hypothetical protein [Terribacillus sp. 7520-G]|uniref:hypothetical protein n=1 Tax=Terribacillus TaxID=459532 RepID=UPI000BA5D829|nr:hypothetical protein [Terribacillus sp. 7520-G]PAD38635.1 hypothetical protein CHH53_10425 [Terribacillus sp. 7520-G]
MQYKAVIPHIYYSLAAHGAAAGDDKDDKREKKIEKYEEYVTGYIAKTYPGWSLKDIDIQQRIALLARKK